MLQRNKNHPEQFALRLHEAFWDLRFTVKVIFPVVKRAENANKPYTLRPFE